MNIAEYHAHPAIGKSTLDLIARDPALVLWAKKAISRSPSQALLFGDAFHAMLLEPMRFLSSFSIEPQLDRRTKAGKEAAEAFCAESAGRQIISHDDYEVMRLMHESVMAHPIAQRLIEEQGEIEQSHFWIDSDTRLECKCRPDKAIKQRGILIDIKTTPSVSKFMYSVEDYRYHVQAAWYLDGVRNTFDVDRMVFIVVGKNQELGRYPVHVCTLPEEVVMYGRQEARRNLKDYARFTKQPEPSSEIKELVLHDKFLASCTEGLEVEL